MRKLNDGERAYVKKYLEDKTQKITYIMRGFRIFGLLQILAIVLYAVLGNSGAENIPFMLVGCVILYLVYFKFTGFLAKQNQWKRLLETVKKGKETVFDGELIHTYETRHGDSSGARVDMANVNVDGKRIRCNAEASLMGKPAGNRVVVVCTYATPDMGFVLAILGR